MEKRYFTLEEAREMLPYLKELTGKMVRLYGQLEDFREEVQSLANASSQNSGGPAGSMYLEILIALQSYLAKVQKMGCLVRSVEEGLVDFSHLKDGREVYLCWKYGEDDIRFWHEVDTGFAGRIPLPE